MHGRTTILILTRMLVEPDPRNQAKRGAARLMGQELARDSM